VKKRLRFRSYVLTGTVIALVAVAWHFFAPSNIGGSTRYVVTSGVSMQPHFHTGDLAITRPASTYKVGEVVAYHSTVLHVTVLHRIIARHGNRYVFKGDNNNFIDPVQPTRAELLGKLWIHVPHGGFVLKALHAPIVAAVLCALVGLFALFGAGQKRGRRKRRRQGESGSNRPGIPLVNGPRHHDGTRPTNYGALLAASAFAVAAFAVLAAIAFARPAHHRAAKVTPYSQRVTFAYSAHVRRNPVYPDGRVITGDPVFLTMVRQLNLHIDYRLVSDAATNLTGSEKVALTMTGPSGWKRSFVLTPSTRFSGSHTSTDVSLDLSQLQGLLSQIEKLTASPGFGTFSLSVGPQVSVSGTVAGRPVSTSFHPALSFSFASGQLQVAGGASGAASASSPGASATSAADFTQTQSGSVSAPTTAATTLPVFGIAPQIATLRWIAIIGLLASIAVTLYFYLRKRGEPFEETFRIMAQYGHMIVPIVGGEDLGWPPVDVTSIKALVRLAESGQRLILHNRSDDVDTYMVNEEGTVYRYQVKPSKVIWGDWSQDAGPVRAAA
jgi:signal peptidase I